MRAVHGVQGCGGIPCSPAVDTADLSGRLRISTLPEEITVYPAECCYSSADSDRRSAKYVMDVDSHSVDLISEAFSFDSIGC